MQFIVHPFFGFLFGPPGLDNNNVFIFWGNIFLWVAGVIIVAVAFDMNRFTKAGDIIMSTLLCITLGFALSALVRWAIWLPFAFYHYVIPEKSRKHKGEEEPTPAAESQIETIDSVETPKCTMINHSD